MAASGSFPIPTINPSRSGFFPSFPNAFCEANSSLASSGTAFSARAGSAARGPSPSATTAAEYFRNSLRSCLSILFFRFRQHLSGHLLDGCLIVREYHRAGLWFKFGHLLGRLLRQFPHPIGSRAIFQLGYRFSQRPFFGERENDM